MVFKKMAISFVQINPHIDPPYQKHWCDAILNNEMWFSLVNSNQLKMQSYWNSVTSYLPSWPASQQTTKSQTDNDNSTSNSEIVGGTVVGATVVGGTSTVVVPAVVSSLGFTSSGIAGGSIAASMMSSAAVANGGGVAAGGLVAGLQSVGAVGSIGLTTAVLPFAVVGGMVGVGTVLGYKYCKRIVRHRRLMMSQWFRNEEKRG